MKTVWTAKGQPILVDDEDYELVSQYTWWLNHAGHAETDIWMKKEKVSKKMRMHRLILGFPGSDIEHKNGIKSDNRRCNMSIGWEKDNSLYRQSVQKNNQSGFRGVYRVKDTDRWAACITYQHRKTHLGVFATPEEAYQRYCGEVKKLRDNPPKPPKTEQIQTAAMTTKEGVAMLPPEAREALRRAAQTPNTPDDPLAKQKAIERCTARLKLQYPQCFHITEE